MVAQSDTARIIDNLQRKSAKRAIDRTIEAGLSWLDAEQNEEGFWCGMLESNCCMEAEWIMAFHVMGLELPHLDQIVSGILSKQRSDGSFETYFDAPSGDVNSTVESYVALRIAGVDPDSKSGWLCLVNGHGLAPLTCHPN